VTNKEVPVTEQHSSDSSGAGAPARDANQGTNPVAGREAGTGARPSGPVGTDHEFYAEPVTLTGRDTAGVILALFALLLIGTGGYIWLTPGMSLAKMMNRSAAVASGGAGAPVRGSAVGTGPAPSATSAATPTVAGSGLPLSNQEKSGVESPESGVKTEKSGVGSPDLSLTSTPDSGLRTPDKAPAGPVPPGEDAVLASANGERNASCAQCGMFAGKSYGEVVAQWSNGQIEHFDSWSCVFSRAKDKALRLSKALALAHGATPAAPSWLAASSAWFVYDTKSIKGSMAPFVAAFATKDAADAAQAQDGGQTVNWEGLQAKFK